LPQDDAIFAGQTECQALLKASGYQQYEISAYAKEGARCQHNINYWTFGDYLGIGAGAHGKLSLSCPHNIVRSLKPKSPEQYLNNTRSSLTKIATEELPLEFLINQLRLKSGFTLHHYHTITGLDPSILEPALSTCINENLLTQQDNIYSCTEKGWNFIDNILEKFIT
jgi:oxygen-independent coproporphyrinogen-3 oxidase